MFIIRILTIASLIAGGMIAAAPFFANKFEWLEKPSEKLGKFNYLIGFILIIIGLVKIFLPEGTSSWVYPLRRQYFFGDLLPVIACILLGIVLSADVLAKFFGSKGEQEPGIISFADAIKTPVGLGSIGVAILHNFLFYYVLF